MARSRNVTRRTLLKLGAVTAAGAAAPISTASGQSASAAPATPERQPRNVIFMVADGMSAGVPPLAEAFSQQIRGRGTHWSRIARQRTAVLGQTDMASADSIVPDSASSSSAWGGGRRVNNASINVLPDGTRVTPIGRLVRDAGLALGLVTTTRLADATPAGFAANAPSRRDEDDIAAQYLDVVDVLLGGGGRHFAADRRHDLRDLKHDFINAGFDAPTTRAQLVAASTAARRIGLFSENHLPYAIERRNHPDAFREVPTLSEMAAAALATLSRNERGFLLQVEGGRIDHAAHANDAAALLHEQLDFDDAIGTCVEFADQRPDTLIVITTDHGCGGPGLMGFGPRYSRSSAMFARVAQSKASFDVIIERLNARRNGEEPASAKDVIEIVAAATGIELTPEQAQEVAAATAGQNPHEVNRLQAWFPGMLGQALAQHHGVGFLSGTHTSDWVGVLATGPGAERFHGLRHATDIFAILCDLLDLNVPKP